MTGNTDREWNHDGRSDGQDFCADDQDQAFSSSDGSTESGPTESLRRLTRRGFLGVAGAGAGAAALTTAAPPVAAAVGRRRQNQGDSRRPRDSRNRPDQRLPDPGSPDRFGRMFDNMRPFAEPTDEVREALVELGRPGGILDANDPAEIGPVRLITEPELSPNNPDNPADTAGTTFIGQFLDHDITRDSGSPLGQPLNLRRSVNLRTPRFDLDSVYGGGGAIRRTCTRPTKSGSLSSRAGCSRTSLGTPTTRRSLPSPATTRT